MDEIDLFIKRCLACDELSRVEFSQFKYSTLASSEILLICNFKNLAIQFPFPGKKIQHQY